MEFWGCWSVEIEYRGTWRTVATFISRQAAKDSAVEWSRKNPGRMFRAIAERGE